MIVVALLLLVVSLNGATSSGRSSCSRSRPAARTRSRSPPGRALPATVVPFELIANAMALRSIAFQTAMIAGPALGGLLFIVSPELVYGTAAVLLTIGLVCVLADPRARARARPDEAPTLETVLAGIRFIRRTPVLLGAISLDLFAVLLGGAIALAPVFAQDDPPHRPGRPRPAPQRAGRGRARRRAAGSRAARCAANAGTTLLVVVALFGVSMIVFGLSRWLPLSLAALAVSGFVDMISMNIRSTTVAMVTPDELRGRVLAVEMVFISASNELGAFESGAAAALLGAVPAVVAGGVRHDRPRRSSGSRVFPALTHVGRLEDLRPATSVAVTFRAAMATVRIPPILRPDAGNNRQVEVDGETVREVLESLVATYPAAPRPHLRRGRRAAAVPQRLHRRHRRPPLRRPRDEGRDGRDRDPAARRRRRR